MGTQTNMVGGQVISPGRQAPSPKPKPGRRETERFEARPSDQDERGSVLGGKPAGSHRASPALGWRGEAGQGAII